MDQDDVISRLVAARRIRGVKQAELDERLHRIGEGEWGKNDVGRIERGELPLGPNRRAALAHLLDVPETWFTADDPFAGMRAAEQLGSLQRTLVALSPLLADAERDVQGRLDRLREGRNGSTAAQDDAADQATGNP